MKKKFLLLVIVICIVIAGFAIFLYLNRDDVTIFRQNEEKAYEKSNVVSLPMLKVKTLNPIDSTDKDTYYISKLIFESLFSLDENLVASPQLVSSFNFDKGKKELHLILRNNAYFSNGEPLTAADVKFSIESLISTKNSLYAKYVDTVRSLSVDKQNEYGLTIKYSDLRNAALENLIFPIVSQKQFNEILKSGKKWEEGIIPIGSGAYKISNYNDISEMELSANDYYQNQKPQNKLHFSVLFSNDDTIPMLDTGTISMGISESMSIETLIADKNIKLKNFCAPDAEVVGFNFRSKIMENKDLRKAVATAIDVDKINEDIYYKNGIKNDSIYFPNYLRTKNAGELYKFDIQKAKKFLQKAQSKIIPDDEKRETQDNTAIKIRVLVNKTHSEKILTAEKIIESLKEIGINANLILAENDADFNSKILQHEYDIFVATFHFNETYDLRYLLHSNYNNIIGYSNPELDSLLDKMKTGISGNEAADTYEKIKAILKEDLPYYCILYKTYSAMLSENVKGVDALYFNDYYKDAKNWYCEYQIK